MNKIETLTARIAALESLAAVLIASLSFAEEDPVRECSLLFGATRRLSEKRLDQGPGGPERDAADMVMRALNRLQTQLLDFLREG